MSTAGNKHHNKSGEGVKIKEEIKEEIKKEIKKEVIEETNEEEGVNRMKPVEPVVVVKREAIAGFSGSGVKADIWNESPEMAGQPKVEIIGGTEINGETYFIVKTPDFPITRTMPYAEARSSFPQAVIRYFQKSIEWVESKDVPKIKSEDDVAKRFSGKTVFGKIGSGKVLSGKIGSGKSGPGKNVYGKGGSKGKSLLRARIPQPETETILAEVDLRGERLYIVTSLDFPILRYIPCDIVRRIYPTAFLRYSQNNVLAADISK